MNFLNATLLLGGLAALIPVVLHLIGRKEPQRVKFPAVRFLTKRLETNRRRLQVRRYALLAMRMALVGALALALSQPEVHRATIGQWITVGAMTVVGFIVGGIALWAIVGERSAALRWSLTIVALLLLLSAGGLAVAVAAGGPQPVASSAAPAAVALLVDNGPTSGYRVPGGSTRLEQAAELSTWILGRYPSESRFAWLDRSPRPAAFSLDAATARKGIESLRPLETTRPLPERIEAAIRLLRTSDLPRKTLFILTDLTTASWETVQEDAKSGRIAALIAEEPRVAVHLVDIGNPTQFNLALGQLDIADTTPAAEVATPIGVSVQAERFIGDSDEANRDNETSDRSQLPDKVTLQLKLFRTPTDAAAGLPVLRDGKVLYPPLDTVDRKTISIDAQGVGAGTLELPPLTVGTHHGLVELVSDDPLAIDNVRYFSIKVAEPRRVLIVADDPRERELVGKMLNPYGLTDPRREYELTLVASASLRDLELEPYAAIGLFNPEFPPTTVRGKLETWTRQGGNMFVALGPNIDPQWSEQVATNKPRVDWPFLGSPARVWRKPEPGTFLQVTNPSHPALDALARTSGGVPWSAFRIYYYWELADANEFLELGRMAGTSDLALGQRQVEQGRLIVLTTPLPALVGQAERWNGLFALSLTNQWPVYMVLVNKIFEDLSGNAAAELNVVTGQPVVLAVPEATSPKWQMFAPDQPPVPLDLADQTLVPGIARDAGNYWLRGEGEHVGFSANLPVEATRLTRVEPSLLDQTFGEEQYQLARDQSEIQLAEGESSDGRPLYAIMMLLVVAFFLVEQLLANRFYPSDGSMARGGRGAGGMAVAA